MAKRGFVFGVFLGLFVFAGGLLSAQASGGETSLQAGIRLYGEGRWNEAVMVLRRARAETGDLSRQAEALYWTALAEISGADYETALKDIGELERMLKPGSAKARELAYHKGRVFYYLGRYDEAIILLGNYAAGADDPAQKAAAIYWTGECLYSMGQLEKAEDAFLDVTQNYPASAKYEAASYRVSLIAQKRIETELLELLKWSHEESLKTIEEYQRRERAYDQALIAYQKRIADMMKDSRSADLETENARFRQQLEEAHKRIAELENRGGGGAPVGGAAAVPVPAPASPEASPQSGPSMDRLRALRDEAEALQKQLERGMR